MWQLILSNVCTDKFILIEKTRENGRKFLLCFKMVLSTPGEEVKVFKKAVGVFIIKKKERKDKIYFIKLSPSLLAGTPPRTL